MVKIGGEKKDEQKDGSITKNNNEALILSPSIFSSQPISTFVFLLFTPLGVSAGGVVGDLGHGARHG